MFIFKTFWNSQNLESNSLFFLMWFHSDSGYIPEKHFTSDVQSYFKITLVSNMEQDCFQSTFSLKNNKNVISQWFPNDFKMIFVAKMKQRCFQSTFSWKKLQESDFKVDFSCKNEATLLPEHMFLENCLKKWCQSDFQCDFSFKNEAKLLPEHIFVENHYKRGSAATFNYYFFFRNSKNTFKSLHKMEVV